MSGTDDADAVTVARMAAEMMTLGTMEVVFYPLKVLQVVGLLQLALRHEQIAAQRETAETARTFISMARQYFAGCPAVLDTITRGDDPAQDRGPRLTRQ